METKHTPGEWGYAETLFDESGSYGIYASPYNKVLQTIMPDSAVCFEEEKANAERIITCVNAMDGLTNEQVKGLRAERDKMLKSFERILKMIKSKSELDTSCVDHYSTIRRLARTALENADLYLEDK